METWRYFEKVRMMEETAGERLRVVTNTFALYLRMFVSMGISIYAMRLLLSRLGWDGYGVYTAVISLVTIGGFFNGALQNTVQRFLNVEVGQQRMEGARKAFFAGMVMFGCLSLLILLLGESVGRWYLHSRMQIPEMFHGEVELLYQLLLAGFLIRMLQLPYYMVIIAFERMEIIALAGILESVMNLGSILALCWFSSPLIGYALLTVGNVLILLLIYIYYCSRHYPEVVQMWPLRSDRTYLRRMSVFSGWIIWGSCAAGIVQQGMGLLVNHFGSVSINAALGLCQQISNAVNVFVTNFQTAFCPHLVKTCTRGDRGDLHYLVCRTAKYSFFLLSLIVFPILGNLDYVITFFSREPHGYTKIFLCFSLGFLLLNSFACPLFTTIHATGRIEFYQATVGVLMMLILPLAYLFLKLGFPFYFIFVGQILVETAVLALRLYCMKKLVQLSIWQFVREVMLRTGAVAAAMVAAVLLLDFQAQTFWELVLESIVIDLILLILVAAIGMSGSESRFLYHLALSRLKGGWPACRTTGGKTE